MSSKLIFLVSDVKFLYKHIPNFRDKQRFVIQKCIYIEGWKEGFCIFQLNAEKCNILGKMIVHRNRYINLCPEKCNLGPLPIASKEMCSEQLQCFPVSSSTMSLGGVEIHSSTSAMAFWQVFHQFVNILSEDPQQVSMKGYWQYISEIVFDFKEKWVAYNLLKL